MSSRDAQKLDELEGKIEALREENNRFSDDDVALLHKMIKAWRGIMALGYVAGASLIFLTSVAAAAKGWESVTGALKAWLRS